MKILRLDLVAYGPFSGQQLALDEGEHGLHIVYGPNEAGKTSTLRALRCLFFGFPHITADNFQHANDGLRVGAVLHDGNGHTLKCVRRKGRKNTLRAPDDSQILDESLLAKLLGGVGEEAFCRQFGIDHGQLVAGGREIVAGGGEIGQILFATASGFAELNETRRKLAEEAESLFTPNATVKPINRLISEWKTQRKTAKEAQLSTSEWKKQREALDAAAARKNELEKQQAQKGAELARLERIGRALPDIVRRREVLEELAPLENVPPLRAEFADHRRAAEKQASEAELRRADAEEAIEHIKREMEALVVDEAILARQENIEFLRNSLAIHLKAEEDTRARSREREQLLREAAALLRELGRDDLNVQEARELFLTREERLRIQRLGSEYAGLMQRVEQAEGREREVQDALAGIEEELQHLPPPLDAAPLRRALSRVQKRGDLEARCAALRQELSRAGEQAGIELQKLPQWDGTLEALETAPFPCLETIAAFEQQFDELRSERQKLESRHADARRRWEDVDEQLRRLDLEHDVPTEEDLAQARQRRERGWRLIRAALRGDEREHMAEYLVEIGAETLEEAYERSLQQADELADRLRREAERVTEKSLFLAERARQEKLVGELSIELELSGRRRDECQAEWARQWRAAGIEPLSPREMRAWTLRSSAIVESAGEIRRQAENLAALEAQCEELRRELLERLAEFQAASDADGLALEELAARCETILSETEQNLSRRRQLEQDAARHRRAAEAAKEESHQARQALLEWRGQWSEATGRLRLGEGAQPAEAIAVLDGVTELFNKIRDAEDKTARIEAMAADAQRFAENVKNVGSGAAPDLVNAPFVKATTELHQRLEAAKKASIRLNDLQTQRAAAQKRRDAAQEQFRSAQAALKSLCKEAGCDSPESLQAVEEQAARRRDLLRRLEDAEDRLRHEAVGAPLERFIAEALEQDADQAPSLIARLREELDAAAKELGEVNQTIGKARSELDRMDGNANAALAQEEAEQILAQLRDEAERYVRLRLAAEVLRGAIQRHRERNQGPVVRRASELFRELTLGSFAGLRVDYDEEGRAVLIGEREGGHKVPVEGMSDGSCDQLYLALRLASLEHYLESHPPLPFIVDDILITFDDERAAAALAALADLSRRTQVIFFTHHYRLVELARKRLPERDVYIHQLPGPLVTASDELEEEPAARTLFA